MNSAKNVAAVPIKNTDNNNPNINKYVCPLEAAATPKTLSKQLTTNLDEN